MSPLVTLVNEVPPPVPVSETVSGTALALVATLNVASRCLVTVGLNVTLMRHDAPAANTAGQFSVSAYEKGLRPAMPMLPMLNDVLPLLMSVAVRRTLVAPTGTMPNSRLVGLTNEAGVTVSTLDF